jgi:hypothetical protein
MNLASLIEQATDKEQFRTIADYLNFSTRYLEFAKHGLQAVILSQNEHQYCFFQYKDDGYRNVTRPINSNLMFDAETFGDAAASFSGILAALREQAQPDGAGRDILMRTIYTVQQSIGATLDALPAGKSNQARKINGDLFERLIRLLVNAIGIDCTSGTIKVPIRDKDGSELFKTSYQHDLLINNNGELKIIGSVKTSSKDRIDKIFMDKFLYSRLTETEIPHIAIFLNDVQRKGQMPKYGVSATFLPGHFKAYTVKLNPLDGVYYCDIRPNMKADIFLKQHIRTIDRFFYSDLRDLLNCRGQSLAEVEVEENGEAQEVEKNRD